MRRPQLHTALLSPPRQVGIGFARQPPSPRRPTRPSPTPCASPENDSKTPDSFETFPSPKSLRRIFLDSLALPSASSPACFSPQGFQPAPPIAPETCLRPAAPNKHHNDPPPIQNRPRQRRFSGVIRGWNAFMRPQIPKREGLRPALWLVGHRPPAGESVVPNWLSSVVVLNITVILDRTSRGNRDKSGQLHAQWES